MAWTVGDVARLAKVSVRTLHHYDEVGLLGPSGRTEAGYRLYDVCDLERLQQVLFFRELGFALDEIRRIMSKPSFDRREALLAQRALLAEKAARTEAMLTAIDGALDALDEGIHMDEKEMFEVFGEFDPKQYEDEVKQRWGHTEAYRESQRRTKGFTKEDWKRVTSEQGAVVEELAEAYRSGAKPDDDEVQELVERHRKAIENFYTCTPEMHANLGRMYVADPRFTEFYDKHAEGLAQFVCDAILVAEERAAR
jgi:DNA-binding transcriptional MerR regulator